MQSNEIREKFLKFFESKGHKKMPSSSLVPEGDLSVLFTTAGMQQFKAYYTAPDNAQKDFGTKNIVTVQKCIRTGDIEEVGDDTHLTFFEMLGNFSFGGYGKKEAIEYAYEFITKELGLEIDYVSVFKDDESGIPADEESRKIWEEVDSNLTIKDHKKEDNFWGPTGDEGPCGPTTEIYINGVEIWNIVFNQYYKNQNGEYKELDVMGIDTGMGLERLLVQVEKKNNVYETDLFQKPINICSLLLCSYGNNEEAVRIIVDHLKASMFIIGDGIIPGKDKASYVLRKLIQRIARKFTAINEKIDSKKSVSMILKSIYDIYTDCNYLSQDLTSVENILLKEIENTIKKDTSAPQTIEEYLFKNNITPIRAQVMVPGRQIETAHPLVPGKVLFDLVTTKGVDKEMLIDYLKKDVSGYVVTEESLSDLEVLLKQHQKLSQTSSAGMFKGGLANSSEKTIKLHTAHHLLLAALQEKFGKSVKQKGSNITEERLRMDFSFDRKMTDEEKKEIEDRVNQLIEEGIPVLKREMSRDEAEKIGAEMEFGAKYPDKVSVYFVEKEDGSVISKEFCGGPHITNTKEIGKFKILKEEASSAGIRRIKATIE